MKVTLVGKEAVSGTSKKTGKPFAANIVHVAYKKQGVEGSAVDSVWLDKANYPINSLVVGEAYHLDYDSRGYIADFIKV